jgi:sRNA-binding protein
MTKNHNVVAMLAARFPHAFVADSSKPHRPLKLGIDQTSSPSASSMRPAR